MSEQVRGPLGRKLWMVVSFCLYSPADLHHRVVESLAFSRLVMVFLQEDTDAVFDNNFAFFCSNMCFTCFTHVDNFAARSASTETLSQVVGI